MAKATKQPELSKATKGRESIAVRYDLHDLPTAQHKAGLAGLLLQIESMQERHDAGADVPAPPQIVDRGPAFAVVEFTAATTQAMFDDLYAATWAEVEVAKPWPGTTPKTTRDRPVPTNDGKGKVERRFVYDVVQPTGPFLARYTDDGKEVWHKLWRDMLWTVTRGRPTTRGPFNARADGKPTGEGSNAWADLVVHERAKVKGDARTIEVAGAILLGAQAVSAESVPFVDRADHALLLHFWQLTARVFVPESIEADDGAARGDIKWKRQFDGFLLAIPVVSNLKAFCDRYPASLHFLDSAKHRYYPAIAVVSLPKEGAVEFLNGVIGLAHAVTSADRQPAVQGVDYFHYNKAGNNTKLVAHGRVTVDRKFQRDVEGIRRQYRNPLFRHHRLAAAVDRRPWYANFNNPLSERPAELFICPAAGSGGRLPANAAQVAATFAADCHGRFRQISDRLLAYQESGMTTDDPAEAVDDAVFKIVRQYVHRRTLKRMNLKEDANRHEWMPVDAKTGNRRETQDYRDKRHKACEQAFLEFRSRQGEEFARRFAEEMGPFGAHLAKSYRIVARALLTKRAPDQASNDETRLRTCDDVRVLTLLAISAHSRSLTVKPDDNATPPTTATEGN